MATQIAECVPQDLIHLHDNQLMTDSRKVAQVFGKYHRDLLKKIKTLECSDQFLTANFCAVKYNHRGNEYTAYEMTKDGFMFLVMGFTGKQAAGIKERYIQAFNAMADKLRHREQLLLVDNISPLLQGKDARLVAVIETYRLLLRRKSRKVNIEAMLKAYLGVRSLKLLQPEQITRGLAFLQQTMLLETDTEHSTEELVHIPYGLFLPIILQLKYLRDMVNRFSGFSPVINNTINQVEDYLGFSVGK